MDDNPYQSPDAFSDPRVPYPPQVPPRPNPGLVRHVRTVAVLMIIQGCLEMLIGVGVLVMAFVMPRMIVQDMQRQGGFGQGMGPGMDPDTMLLVMTITYAAIGGVLALVAGLRIWAGIRNYNYRSRVLGVIAMASGFITLLICYCFPTALALAIYGLIVYLNNETSEAFRMGEAGHSAKEILATYPAR